MTLTKKKRIPKSAYAVLKEKVHAIAHEMARAANLLEWADREEEKEEERLAQLYLEIVTRSDELLSTEQTSLYQMLHFIDRARNIAYAQRFRARYG